MSDWMKYSIMAVGLIGGAYFAIAMALAIGGVGRSYIKLRVHEALDVDSRQLYDAKIRLWRRLNWWRYPPPEGWHIGFNVARLPMAYHLHVQRYGCLSRAVHVEIHQDIQQWVYLGGLRVRLPDGSVYRLQ